MRKTSSKSNYNKEWHYIYLIHIYRCTALTRKSIIDETGKQGPQEGPLKAEARFCGIHSVQDCLFIITVVQGVKRQPLESKRTWVQVPTAHKAQGESINTMITFLPVNKRETWICANEWKEGIIDTKYHIASVVNKSARETLVISKAVFFKRLDYSRNQFEITESRTHLNWPRYFVSGRSSTVLKNLRIISRIVWE